MLAAGLFAETGAPPAGGPREETVQAFERYIGVTESRITSGGGFLWAGSPERRARLRRGDVLCEPRNPKGDLKIPQGLIHDWRGAVFLPNASLGEVLALLRDYNHHDKTYRPEVVSSRIVDRRGDDYVVHMRLLKRKAITVVLDTDHEIHYEKVNAHCWRSWSRTTRIVEIDKPGSPLEREVPAGKDHGFLWRLNSYWRIQEEAGGTYVECEAVSLSRGVPAALAWLIDPIVRRLPRETLINTMLATRAAIVKK